MLNVNLNEVEIIDDEISNLETLKKLIDKIGSDDPLHLLDLGDVLKKHRNWLKKMPRVKPYFAIKSNPEPTVIKLLGLMGANFDCASKEEIIQVTGLGIPSERIIFANPVKFPTHLEYAKKVGVSLMTADHEVELKKIKDHYPEAKVLIRIRCDSKNTLINLGQKCGCDPEKEAVNLIKLTMQLNLELSGFAFHTGCPCNEVNAFCRGISICNDLIQIAKSLGCKTANIIDIGGGISGDRDVDLDEFAGPINATLDQVDSSIKIIAEPGRYYVTSSAVAAARVIGKKIVTDNEKKVFMYYVTDGVYGSFIHELLKMNARHPVPVNSIREGNEKYISTIWGPTCDSLDCILKEEFLPEYHVGEWLAWYDLGSYAACLSNRFNGFRSPNVYPIMRRTDWESMQLQISNSHSI